MTERELIEACKKGESYAQRLLFERFCDLMFVVCLRYIPLQADAEEVLSDVFTQVFRSLERFEYRGDGSFRAWSTRIAVNECLQFLRKRRAFRFASLDDLPQELPEAAPDGINRLHARELLQLIHSLPAGYRAIFNLYVIEGYQHREIAGLLGISEATSKTQLMKAKAFLRKKLEPDGKRI